MKYDILFCLEDEQGKDVIILMPTALFRFNSHLHFLPTFALKLQTFLLEPPLKELLTTHWNCHQVFSCTVLNSALRPRDKANNAKCCECIKAVKGQAWRETHGRSCP